MPSPKLAAEVEEITVASAARPGHDAAWFAKNRQDIREQLAFFVGADLPGTGYWVF
jgi:hypothetical protein